MNTSRRRSGAAALVLVFCLTLVPVAAAHDREPREPREPDTRIGWVLKKIQRFFGGITTFTDFPNPPKP